MKAVKIDLLGRTRYLSYTVEAMFRLQEEFGGIAELLDAVQDNSRDGLAAACKTVAILAEQGELGRRSMGYDSEPMVDADTLAVTMTPGDMAALKLAIPAVISLGFGREVDPEKNEVDLFLAELNAQKKT